MIARKQYKLAGSHGCGHATWAIRDPGGSRKNAGGVCIPVSAYEPRGPTSARMSFHWGGFASEIGLGCRSYLRNTAAAVIAQGPAPQTLPSWTSISSVVASGILRSTITSGGAILLFELAKPSKQETPPSGVTSRKPRARLPCGEGVKRYLPADSTAADKELPTENTGFNGSLLSGTSERCGSSGPYCGEPSTNHTPCACRRRPARPGRTAARPCAALRTARREGGGAAPRRPERNNRSRRRGALGTGFRASGSRSPSGSGTGVVRAEVEVRELLRDRASSFGSQRIPRPDVDRDGLIAEARELACGRVVLAPVERSGEACREPGGDRLQVEEVSSELLAHGPADRVVGHVVRPLAPGDARDPHVARSHDRRLGRRGVVVERVGPDEREVQVTRRERVARRRVFQRDDVADVLERDRDPREELVQIPAGGKPWRHAAVVVRRALVHPVVGAVRCRRTTVGLLIDRGRWRCARQASRGGEEHAQRQGCQRSHGVGVWLRRFTPAPAPPPASRAAPPAR